MSLLAAAARIGYLLSPSKISVVAVVNPGRVGRGGWRRGTREIKRESRQSERGEGGGGILVGPARCTRDVARANMEEEW